MKFFRLLSLVLMIHLCFTYEILADCIKGEGLDENGNCIPCGNYNQVLHNGKCYNCGSFNSFVYDCGFDEDTNLAKPSMKSGLNFDSEGNFVNCNGRYQKFIDGSCYNVCDPHDYNASKYNCSWNATDNKNSLTPKSGMELAESTNYCNGRYQQFIDGTCYNVCDPHDYNASKYDCSWNATDNKNSLTPKSGIAVDENGNALLCSSGQIVKNGVCVDCVGDECAPSSCTGVNKIWHDGQCYSCGRYSGQMGWSAQAGCRWDEETGSAVAVCKDGFYYYNGGCEREYETAGTLNACSNINQIWHEGKCYSCGNYSGQFGWGALSGCRWDEETDSAVAVCKDGFNLNSSNACHWGCSANQIIIDGQCVSCSTYMSGCSSCGYNKETNRIQCNSCSQGTLIGGECQVSQTKTCEGGQYLTALNTCVSSCPLNYFANVKTGKCELKTNGCDEFNNEGKCVEDCWNGYLNKEGKCIDKSDGCGTDYLMKNGAFCVNKEVGCGSGYLGKEGLCIDSQQGCGAGYKNIDGVCSRVRYTPAEAETISGDTNTITLIYK